ncbi:HU family DNA-binding protein [Microvirga aerilata]|uniref:HU family DNA-binding protein n=1 Tax=Microvirga aerilata TaxID=670292 RepID=UPI0035E41EBD
MGRLGPGGVRSVRTSAHEAAAVVEQVLSEITDTLVTGESVKLSGFGVFTVRDRAKLVGRTPRPGSGCRLNRTAPSRLPPPMS